MAGSALRIVYYAVPAGNEQIENIGEWIMHYGRIPVSEYQQYSENSTPVNYDPEAWVRLAKDAGMKYIVITAKHHDGFALFDTAASDWNVVDSTPHAKDQAEAAQTRYQTRLLLFSSARLGAPEAQLGRTLGSGSKRQYG